MGEEIIGVALLFAALTTSSVGRPGQLIEQYRVHRKMEELH